MDLIDARESLEPKTWGPPLWKSLDFIVDGYPITPSPKLMSTTQYFFQHCFGPLLPCEECRVHYDAFLITSPPRVDGQIPLREWLGVLKTNIADRNRKSIRVIVPTKTNVEIPATTELIDNQLPTPTHKFTPKRTVVHRRLVPTQPLARAPSSSIAGVRFLSNRSVQPTTIVPNHGSRAVVAGGFVGGCRSCNRH